MNFILLFLFQVFVIQFSVSSEAQVRYTGCSPAQSAVLSGTVQSASDLLNMSASIRVGL